MLFLIAGSEKSLLQETAKSFAEPTVVVSASKISGVRRSSRLASKPSTVDDSLSSTVTNSPPKAESLDKTNEASVKESETNDDTKNKSTDSDVSVTSSKSAKGNTNEKLTEPEHVTIIQTDEAKPTEDSSSPKNKKSSTRRSISVKDQTLENVATPGANGSHKTRRSVASVESVQKPVTPVPTSGRKTRRSVGMASDSEGGDVTPSRSTRPKRRSILSVPEAEPIVEESAEHVARVELEGLTAAGSQSGTKVETPGRPVRKAKRKSMLSVPEAETITEEADETKAETRRTPGPRRSSRLSMAAVAEVLNTSAEKEMSDEQESSNEVVASSSIPFVGPNDPNELPEDDDNVFNDSLKENVSPRLGVKTPKHIRNKSFGGFRYKKIQLKKCLCNKPFI